MSPFLLVLLLPSAVFALNCNVIHEMNGVSHNHRAVSCPADKSHGCVRLNIQQHGELEGSLVIGGCDDGTYCQGNRLVPRRELTPQEFKQRFGTPLPIGYTSAEFVGKCCYGEYCN